MNKISSQLKDIQNVIQALKRVNDQKTWSQISALTLATLVKQLEEEYTLFCKESNKIVDNYNMITQMNKALQSADKDDGFLLLKDGEENAHFNFEKNTPVGFLCKPASVTYNLSSTSTVYKDDMYGDNFDWEIGEDCTEVKIDGKEYCDSICQWMDDDDRIKACLLNHNNDSHMDGDHHGCYAYSTATVPCLMLIKK